MQLSLLESESKASNNTGFTPYPYQAEMIDRTFDCFHKNINSVLLQLCTGGGKTVIFSEIAKRFINRGESVLVLAHREELLNQAANKLAIATGHVHEPSIIKSGYSWDIGSPIQVASVQTLTNRIDTLRKQFGLVIVDEAHHIQAKSYLKIINSPILAGIPKIGVSATPIRTNGDGFADVFGEMIRGPKMRWLIENGFLSDYRLLGWPSEMITRGVTKVAGDYNRKQLAEANDVVKLSGDLFSSYDQHAPGRQGIVFAIDVDYSRYIADYYSDHGVPAVHLDGESDPSYRRECLAALAEGEIKVISNYGLFSEGVDIPAIDFVQVARPTASLALWLQMLGRGLRVKEGKDRAILMDHTDNWSRLFPPDYDHDWQLGGTRVRKTTKEDPERFERNEDHQIVLVKAPRSVNQDKDRKLVEITPDMTEVAIQKAEEVKIEELLRIQYYRDLKPGFVVNQFLKMKPTYQGLLALARKLNYKEGWAAFKYNELKQKYPEHYAKMKEAREARKQQGDAGSADPEPAIARIDNPEWEISFLAGERPKGLKNLKLQFTNPQDCIKAFQEIGLLIAIKFDDSGNVYSQVVSATNGFALRKSVWKILPTQN